MSDTVIRENGRVVIAGLESARISENSFIASLAHAMRAMGEPYDHAYLMGMSGAAFRVQMMQPDWCPSAPHSACGYYCIEPAMEAIPYQLVRVHTQRDDPEAMDALWERVTASIGGGTPVLMTGDETGLVTGYVADDRTLLCRPYLAREDGYVPVGSNGMWTQWPWAFELLEASEMTLSRAELIRGSLERAIMLANTPVYRSQETRSYASGFAAYRFWIDGLRNEGWFASMDEEARSTAMMANGHCYYCLWEARGSASTYLRSICRECDDGVRAHLEAVAEVYDKIIAELTNRCLTEVAPMPFMLPQGQSWTQAKREAQADILEGVLALGRRAIGEIEAVRQAMS